MRRSNLGARSSVVMKAKKSDEDIESYDPAGMIKKEIKYDISHLKKGDFGNEPGAFSETETLALKYHAEPTPGKYTIVATKKMDGEKDLALAYSPGVAEPCLEIEKDPSAAYRYTNKGNMVAVITNGTAVLGLGNIGALASKPVMEGKSVLMNKFAGVNSIDICVDTADPDEFINCVKYLSPSFAGVNLEDIRGPDCFYVEEMLKQKMDIPVFHDDQHGTAIVCLAGIINALELQEKEIKDCNIVINGAGAAGIACLKLLLEYGADPKKCIACDS